jgi:hypothetical protein
MDKSKTLHRNDQTCYESLLLTHEGLTSNKRRQTSVKTPPVCKSLSQYILSSPLTHNSVDNTFKHGDQIARSVRRQTHCVSEKFVDMNRPSDRLTSQVPGPDGALVRSPHPLSCVRGTASLHNTFSTSSFQP